MRSVKTIKVNNLKRPLWPKAETDNEGCWNKMMTITIEDMINEGSLTPRQAMYMGYRWDAVVIGGDAFEIRENWLKSQNN
ncbi:MAG: hypothetical protein ACI9IA_000728 [Enterobacterales bacterium]